MPPLRREEDVGIERELREIDRLLAINKAEQQRAAVGVETWRSLVGGERDVRVREAMPGMSREVVHKEPQVLHARTHYVHTPPPAPIEPREDPRADIHSYSHSQSRSNSDGVQVTHQQYQNMLKASKRSQDLVAEQAERLSYMQDRLRVLEENPPVRQSSVSREHVDVAPPPPPPAPVDPPPARVNHDRTKEKEGEHLKVLADLTNQLTGVVHEVAEIKKSIVAKPAVPTPAPPEPQSLVSDADLSFERKQVATELLELERDMVKQLKTAMHTEPPKTTIEVEHHHVHHRRLSTASTRSIEAPVVAAVTSPAAPLHPAMPPSAPISYRSGPRPYASADSVFEANQPQYCHAFNATNQYPQSHTSCVTHPPTHPPPSHPPPYSQPSNYIPASRSASNYSMSPAMPPPRVERRVSTPASHTGIPLPAPLPLPTQSMQRQELNLSPPRSVPLSPFASESRPSEPPLYGEQLPQLPKYDEQQYQPSLPRHEDKREALRESSHSHPISPAYQPQRDHQGRSPLPDPSLDVQYPEGGHAERAHQPIQHHDRASPLPNFDQTQPQHPRTQHGDRRGYHQDFPQLYAQQAHPMHAGSQPRRQSPPRPQQSPAVSGSMQSQSQPQSQRSRSPPRPDASKKSQAPQGYDNNVNRINREGQTPLLEACHNVDARRCKELILLGASVEIPDADGWTPLHVASQKGGVECMKVLLEARAAVDCRDCDGSTPLVVAALEGCVEAVKVLLLAGADHDAADDDGATALMVAAQAGHEQVIELLLRSGADPLREDGTGNTARLIAMTAQTNPRCLSLLQKAEQLTQPHVPTPKTRARHFSVSPRQNLSFVF